MEEIFCYNRLVIENFEKKEESIAMKVAPSIKREIERIAFEDDRTVSYVAGELMNRGLALYRRDGKLRDDQSFHSKEAKLIETNDVIVAVRNEGTIGTKQPIKRRTRK